MVVVVVVVVHRRRFNQKHHPVDSDPGLAQISAEYLKLSFHVLGRRAFFLVLSSMSCVVWLFVLLVASVIVVCCSVFEVVFCVVAMFLLFILFLP